MTRLRTTHGMTVVELIVVMAIVASIMGAAVWGLASMGSNDVRGEAMRLSSVIKYAYSNAGINNTRYRLVIDVSTGEYWTEITDEPVVTQRELAEEGDEAFLTDEARELGERRDEEDDLFDEDEADPFGMNRKVTFERVQDGVVEPRTLREGVRFARVHTVHSDEPIEEGRAFVSFFPNGFQEQVMIVLADEGGATFTLITEPMTGRVRLYSDDMEVPEDFGQPETDD